MECKKCGGKGKLVQYSHIEKGICFRCWGTKIEPTTPKEIHGWLDRARQEYRARRDALRTARGKKKAFLTRELGIIERQGKAAKARLAKLEKAGSRCQAIQVFPVATFQSFSEEGKTYEIRQARDGSYYCSCPGWKFQKRPVKQRTCKHIEAFLRDKARAKRAPARKAVGEGEQLRLGIG